VTLGCIEEGEISKEFYFKPIRRMKMKVQSEGNAMLILTGHESTRLTTFRLYDAWVDLETKVQNENGDVVWSEKAVGTMSGNKGVRVLIPQGTTKPDALRLLKRVIDFVEVSGVDPDETDDADFI